MPIFEYRCSECGTSIEKIQRKPADEIPCPACGRPAKRIVSAFATTNSAVSGASGCAGAADSGFS